MNKEPKTLPQAIKIIVGIYGKNVLKDVQMVNILNDVVSLEDPNAVKSILRDVIKQGYGGRLLAINVPKEDYQLKVKAFSKEISDSFGYKEVIVQYILYSIAYGIGICPQEPYLKKQVFPKHEKKEEQAPTKEKSISVEERKLPNKVIITCCFVLLLGFSVWGFGYWKASEDREQFENKVFSGNSFLSNGNYDQAVESYKDAYNSYNAINSSKYKGDALGKIDDLVDKLIKEGETNNKSLSKANSILESELQLDLNVSDKERLTIKKNEVEQKIVERTDNGRNTLITILSANKGKLDENGLQLLTDLLILAPNDYWLNFIKKKSYE